MNDSIKKAMQDYIKQELSKATYNFFLYLELTKQVRKLIQLDRYYIRWYARVLDLANAERKQKEKLERLLNLSD